MKNLFVILVVGMLGLGFVYKIALGANAEKDKKGGEGIRFYKGKWSVALAKAKEEGLPIFLDVQTSWCGWCRKLEKNTFSDSKVGELYNKRFLNVSIDGESEEGSILVNQYGIEGYPALLFFDEQGRLLIKHGGYQNANEFIKLGNYILEKLETLKKEQTK